MPKPPKSYYRDLAVAKKQAELELRVRGSVEDLYCVRVYPNSDGTISIYNRDESVKILGILDEDVRWRCRPIHHA